MQKKKVAAMQESEPRSSTKERDYERAKNWNDDKVN